MSGWPAFWDDTAEREHAEEAAADDWRREDCGCGHGHSSHANAGTGACSGTRRVFTTEGLPPPEYAPGTHPDDFLAVPVNWPFPLPQVTGPCGCRQFADPEPSDPEE